MISEWRVVPTAGLVDFIDRAFQGEFPYPDHANLLRLSTRLLELSDEFPTIPIPLHGDYLDYDELIALLDGDDEGSVSRSRSRSERARDLLGRLRSRGKRKRRDGGRTRR